MLDHIRYLRMWADVLYVGQPNGCHGISPAMPKQKQVTILETQLVMNASMMHLFFTQTVQQLN